MIVKRPRGPEIRRLSKVMDGYFAASKKSEDRRCSSRRGSPVISVVTSMLALTEESFGSSPASTMVPESPVKRPLTVDTIMWRTPNSTRLCAGSICQTDQLAAAGAVVLAAVLDMLPRVAGSRALSHRGDPSHEPWCVPGDSGVAETMRSSASLRQR